jgi:putative ABC transport system permease protein
MKYWPLIWSGIWRKRSRATLMLLQILAAFLLFGLLQGIKSGVDQAAAGLQANLYLVQPAEAGTALPIALEQRIRSVPGVKRVYIENFFAATYQRPTQQLLVFTTDFDAGWVSDMGISASPQAVAAMAGSRTAALMSTQLAARYGWKIGDRIPLLSHTARQDGSTNWSFDIVGTFEPAFGGGLDNAIIIRNDYYDEARQRNRGTVAQYVLDVTDVAQGAAIARRIDALSSNSPFETRTQSFRALVQSALQSLGDLNFIVRSVIGAALFALLISTAAMTMQAVRERTIELAVLKTVGFSDPKVFGMLLAESLTLSIGAAAIGLALAFRVVPLVSRFINLHLTMPPEVLAGGIVLACVLALVSTALPAWRALHLQVAEALAGR